MSSVFLNTSELAQLRHDMSGAALSVSAAAEGLGISRTHLSKMLNARAAMLQLYRYAIQGLIHEKYAGVCREGTG